MRNKAILFALFVILIGNNLFGQTSSGLQYVDDYFNNQDLTTIDPIEGYYRGQISVDISAPAYGLKRTSKDELEGFIRNEGGVLKFNFSMGEGSFKRIGESNAYNYRFIVNLIGGKKQTSGMLTINNGTWQFQETEQFPREGVFREYYFTFVKSFPTTSMYAEAFQNKLDKQQEQIEIAEPKIWSGTGFALNDGYIVTNYHVIDNASKIKVSGINGNFSNLFDAFVYAKDINNDIAIIKINDSKFKGFGSIPYNIKNTTSDVGEEIFVLDSVLISKEKGRKIEHFNI